ncbi:SDR family NAD(P)-dependent oxidoreductase [Gemmatimonas sp.]|uniref:SDR family NAD(P)-dependent oxidoreductase n=1 Tax=Gemmatimonas sp. TaxID=1962908 RepID=UPI0039837B5B
MVCGVSHAMRSAPITRRPHADASLHPRGSVSLHKTVVVTGCSSGFGREVGERMARRGDRVYATMRDIDGRHAGVANGMRALASADGNDLRVLELDVCSKASVDAAAATMLAAMRVRRARARASPGRRGLRASLARQLHMERCSRDKRHIDSSRPQVPNERQSVDSDTRLPRTAAGRSDRHLFARA